MRLYLVRHGDAASANVDPQRSLSEIGKDEIGKVAQFLKTKGLEVNNIYHSEKKRARQTAEIIRDTISQKIQLVQKDYLSPDDPTDNILDEILNTNDNFMIVGHLPFLPELASRLISGHKEKEVVKFNSGTVVALERVDNKNWHVIWSVSPDEL